MSTCADCGKIIDMLEASYCSRGPAGIVIKHYHTACGDPFGLKAKDAEIKRLQELLRGVGANRYWEGRWRDEKSENDRLRAALRTARNWLEGFQQTTLTKSEHDELQQDIDKADAALAALEQKAGD